MFVFVQFGKNGRKWKNSKFGKFGILESYKFGNLEGGKKKQCTGLNPWWGENTWN